MYKPEYFQIEELVCPDTYRKYGESAWQFFDPRLLETLDFIRDRLAKPIYVNNWDTKGNLTQRGLRCNLCPLVKSKTLKSQMYLSSHIMGRACDFDVKEMTAQKVRDWLVANKEQLPYPICLEDGVTWVHLDMRDKGDKVYLFKA